MSEWVSSEKYWKNVTFREFNTVFHLRPVFFDNLVIDERRKQEYIFGVY